MSNPSLRAVPARFLPVLALTAVAVLLAACGSQDPTSTPQGSSQPSGASQPASATPQPTATPLPTPLPTPQYTNPPDRALARLIPERVAGTRITIPDREEFALTPGDFGAAYGDLGLQFTALQVAYVVEPRLSLYVARVSDPHPTTRELEPHLATAGQYVGIAGLHRKEWRYRRVDGRVTWVRPEDNATAAGTMIYTWAADGYVFLLIGVDDGLNRALFRALPGERAAATPSSSPSGSASPAGSALPSPSGSP
jgi:hypothetical protein